MSEKKKKYKLIALTRVGRTDKLMKQGDMLLGTWQEVYDRLNACFISGCELEQQGKTTKYKVYAGWGSHVADIQLIPVDKPPKTENKTENKG